MGATRWVRQTHHWWLSDSSSVEGERKLRTASQTRSSPTSVGGDAVRGSRRPDARIGAAHRRCCTGLAASAARQQRCFGYVSSRAGSRIGPTLRRRALGSSTRRVPAGNPRHRKPFGGPGTRERLPARLDFAPRRVRPSSSEPGAPRVARPAHRIEVVAAVWLLRKRAGATSGGPGFGQGHPEATSWLVQASARSDRELPLGGSRARPVSIAMSRLQGARPLRMPFA